MSPYEIARRVGVELRTRLESKGFLTAISVPKPVWKKRPNQWLKEAACSPRSQFESVGREIAGGRVQLFGIVHSPQLTANGWNRDPLTGREAPLEFGKRIDYRNELLVGNIKYLWESNRHLELVTLALAFKQTRSERYLQGIREYLTSWLDQCPYPQGVNWASSLELGIRLINWSLTWQLIGQVDSPLFAGTTGARLRDCWLQSIYQHAHFIHHYYSRHSSANNHLIGEATGVYVASCTWPCWREMERWGHRGRSIIIEQAAAQTHMDGVNREQAIAYHRFVLDLLIIAALAGRASGDEFPVDYWRIIERMIEFIRSMMDINGNVPMLGDSDDGQVVRISHEPDFCPYRSLLATGAILFNRPDFAVKSGGLDDKTRLLVGSKNWDDLRRRGRKQYSPPCNVFPEGGYYVLGSALERADEVRLIADAGSLGYLSIAAHGHADALSVVLSIAGREILIDPGTYAYHTKPLWRQYFRSTGAHNTVRVDAQDQSVQGGNFMWLEHARARCLKFQAQNDGGVFIGMHDGYRRLSDPVTHEREIRLDSKEIEVIDRLRCRGAHQIERCWHFSEDCRVSADGSSVVAENGPIRVTLRAAEPVREFRKLRGSVNPPGGWVSRHFDIKIPSDSIYFVNDIRGSCELKTLIQWKIDKSLADEH